MIRVKWKQSAETMHSTGEKLLSHPKTHIFKENNSSPLNQRIKEMLQ